MPARRRLRLAAEISGRPEAHLESHARLCAGEPESLLSESPELSGIDVLERRRELTARAQQLVAQRLQVLLEVGGDRGEVLEGNPPAPVVLDLDHDDLHFAIGVELDVHLVEPMAAPVLELAAKTHHRDALLAGGLDLASREGE